LRAVTRHHTSRYELAAADADKVLQFSPNHKTAKDILNRIAALPNKMPFAPEV
jgi:hypothetical protein